MEEVIQRYDGGDKKVVGYYDGEGSNEVIVKQFIIILKMMEEEKKKKRIIRMEN